MSDLSYVILGKLRFGLVFALAFTLWHCGGTVADDGTGGTGGTTGGSSVATGSTTSTPYTGATVCYGVPSTDLTCVGLTDEIDPDEQGADCVFSISIPSGLRLNPDYLKLYFDIDANGKLEIPYVGVLASCPTSGTAGGWYATNTTGGSTQVGLCGCTCLAAKKYTVTLNVACAGVGI